MTPPTSAVDRLAQRQGMAVTTAQLLALGARQSWVDRRVRSGRWQRLHRGVLVLHSGPVPWRSRAWAAVLYAGAGAALSHRSAGHLLGFVDAPPRTIEVSVPADRRVAPSPGLRMHHRRRMPPVIGRLPAVDRADTVVDLLAQARTTDDAVGVVCAAVRDRVWPEHILQAASRRRRLGRRQLLHDLLSDVTEGVESPLERRYHHDVERRHGLPRAQLQVRQRVGGRWLRADRVYVGFGVRAELDGELAHPGGRTDADVWRDNAVLISRSELTLRYRWRHVATTPCRTAAQVAAALTARGWHGRLRPCAPSCTALT